MRETEQKSIRETPTQIGPNRYTRRRVAAQARKLGQDRTQARCNGCGKKILDLPVKRLTENPHGVERAIKAAVAAHRLKTGCTGVKPPPTLAQAIPEGPTAAECICAGCGLIVITVPTADAREKPAETQEIVTKALREHVAATGCLGVRDPSTPAPRRRDARCSSSEHFADCRCEREPTIEAPAQDVPAPEPLAHDGGVFELLIQRDDA
jgi:hypothetical protein